MAGAAVEVPAVELVLAGADVEEDTGSRLIDVEVNGGLGAEG